MTAERQSGVVTRGQLLAAGVTRSRIGRLCVRGILHRQYPAVYALGHRALGVHGRLTAALLHVGPGAGLGGGTAAWWFEVIPNEPPLIHVITPRQVTPATTLRITRRPVEPVMHRGLPTCPIERVLIDIAASVPAKRLRKAVSEALYRRLTTVEAIEAELKPGRTGSAIVRAALERHRGGFQHSRSELEEAFLLICERAGIQIPLVNRKIAGYEVDMYWPDFRLAVEIDGPGHAEIARMTADRAREMALRAIGVDLIRYSRTQVVEDAGTVAAELVRELAKRQRADSV